jgi:hypothetical protein
MTVKEVVKANFNVSEQETWEGRENHSCTFL